MKRWVFTAAKLTLACAIVAWLVLTGQLDFKQMSVFVERPAILAGCIAFSLFGSVGLGGLRWYLLLRGLDLDVPFRRLLQFQMIGLFFNTALPGAVGGDVAKGIYAVRELRGQQKTSVILTIIMDRALGLASLFLMAGVGLSLNTEFFLANERLHLVARFVQIGIFSLVCVGLVAFYPHKADRDPLAAALRRRLPGFSLLSKAYTGLREYRHRPWSLVAAIAISCLNQTASMLLALVIASATTGQLPPISIFATIYPVAVMTTAIPLAPGGFGIGHVAFERLFALTGISGGASIFNIIVLSTLALDLIGIVPYLLHRSDVNLSDVEREYLAMTKETS